MALLALVVFVAMPAVPPTGLSIVFGPPAGLGAALSATLASPSLPAWEQPGAEQRASSHRPRSAPSVHDESASALHTWLPSYVSVALPSARSSRLATLATHGAGDARIPGSAEYGVAPALVLPLPFALGLRWARSLRGPPAAD